jgi:4-hydroxy-tetrahydrodipicolinate reductase
MGRRIISAALDSARFDIIAALEKTGCPDIGKDAGELACGKSISLKIADSWPAGADVAIDFSQPAAADDTISRCVDKKIALVLGTTGLTPQQHEKIKAASAKIPVLYSTNTSLGMNVLFALVGKLASMLGEDYDIEIVEQHHRFKKDAPSGSAITLAENICKATGSNFSDTVIFGRHGKDALRKKGQLAIHSVRAGDITGVHSVIFGTTGETISLNHTANNPDCFAKGACLAAAWLVGKKPALYSMADVLNIK